MILAHGCSAAGDDEPTGGDDQDEGEAGQQIAFEGIRGAIKLSPLEQRRLPVVVRPEGTYEVRFALLPGPSGEPNDAVLNHDVAETDDSGRAEVVLTAASAPTSFRLRASTSSASTTIDVEIAAANEVTLEVVPVYSGARETPLWSASVYSGITCETLAVGTASAERHAESTSRSILVRGVPVGRVAVVARAGRYVEGCATLNEVMEGASHQVLVPVSDRPIRLDLSDLDLKFGFSSVSPEWHENIDAVIASARAAMLNGATDDVHALLDEMQALLPAAQASEFAERRLEYGWDQVLIDKLGRETKGRLRDAAEAWMRAGQQKLAASDAILGEVWSDTKATPELEGATQAVLRFISVGGYSPETAGFPERTSAVWSADSQDIVLLSGTIPWYPSRLLAALAEGPARQTHPTASDVAQALSFEIGCSVVASSLVTASPGGIYGGDEESAVCQGSCTTKLCRDAVAAMWERAAKASGSEPRHFEFSATGQATVGYNAEIVTLSGSWVGKDRDGEAAATAGGHLSASAY